MWLSNLTSRWISSNTWPFSSHKFWCSRSARQIATLVLTSSKWSPILKLSMIKAYLNFCSLSATFFLVVSLYHLYVFYTLNSPTGNFERVRCSFLSSSNKTSLVWIICILHKFLLYVETVHFNILLLKLYFGEVFLS